MAARSRPFFLFLFSCAFVAWGCPAQLGWLGPIAGLCGYAIFWTINLDQASWKKRFLSGTCWFFFVQLVWLSWFLSHPYFYIVPVYILLSAAIGIQFGFVSIFMTRSRLRGWKLVFCTPSLWVLFEWSRLFWFSGFSFDPIGLSLSSFLPLRVLASLFGVYGLSFLAMASNVLLLKAFCHPKKRSSWAFFVATCLGAFLTGQVLASLPAKEKEATYKVLLVQTGFPVQEAIDLRTHQEQVDVIAKKWKKIFLLLEEYRDRTANLIVIPETVLPFGAYTFVYPTNVVELIGVECAHMEFPLTIYDPSRNRQMISNACLAQAIADRMGAPLVIGLEDAEDHDGVRHYYSSALFFQPMQGKRSFTVGRYNKRKLVPMGEYIPFSFCRTLCARYGVFGSFEPGKDPVVWEAGEAVISPSICYDETFGGVMQEGGQMGAHLFVNLTNDGWFPNSTLPRQHLEHAKMRAVENGLPLVRACNTGLTCAVDALGREIAVLGSNDQESQRISGVLEVDVPIATRKTLYTLWGEKPLLFFCVLFSLIFLL